MGLYFFCVIFVGFVGAGFIVAFVVASGSDGASVDATIIMVGGTIVVSVVLVVLAVSAVLASILPICDGLIFSVFVGAAYQEIKTLLMC